MKKIWCLFGIFNDYNQPDTELYAWWSKKPEHDDVSKALINSFDQKDIKKILDGKNVRIGEIEYRLREISEGPLQEKESE